MACRRWAAWRKQVTGVGPGRVHPLPGTFPCLSAPCCHELSSFLHCALPPWCLPWTRRPRLEPLKPEPGEATSSWASGLQLGKLSHTGCGAGAAASSLCVETVEGVPTCLTQHLPQQHWVAPARGSCGQLGCAHFWLCLLTHSVTLPGHRGELSGSYGMCLLPLTACSNIS